jgi:hypothetical protein
MQFAEHTDHNAHTAGMSDLDALRVERDAASGSAKAALTRKIKALEAKLAANVGTEPTSEPDASAPNVGTADAPAPKRAGRRADVARYRKGTEFEAFLASELRAAGVTADALTAQQVYAVGDPLVADNLVLGCPARWAGVWATEPVLRRLRNLPAADTDTPAPPRVATA